MGVMELNAETIAVILVALTFGGISKSITGVGLPMLAIPLMSGMIGIQNAVLVMVLPGIVSNLWMMWAYRDQAGILKKQWVFLLMGLIGGAVGAWVLVVVDEHILMLVLAVWTAIALIIAITKPPFMHWPGFNTWVPPIAGTAAGVSQGALGVSAPVVATYFYSLNLEMRAYVFAVSVAFLFFGASQAVAFIELGLYTETRIIGGLIALVPLFVTIPVGLWLAKFISKRAFNLIIIVMLILMDGKLIIDAVNGLS